MDYSPIVLKNKGIEIALVKVIKIDGAEDYVREYAEDGEPVIEKVWLRFNNNVISDIEEHYGGLELWQQRLENHPISTLRQTLAFALRRHVVAIGEAMIEGENLTYSNAIGIAWAIANGVDPIVASRMLKQSAALADEQKQAMQSILTEQVTIQDSLGESGSQPGPKRAARTKSSGTSAQPK